MTKEQKDYLVDLLYVLQYKEKKLQHSNKMTVELFLTQDDITDLKTIIQEVIKYE